MKSFQSVFASIVMLLCCMPLSAHEFAVNGIYYNITSSTVKTVEVTYRGSEVDSYHNEYTGDVYIPASVTYNGSTYNVIGIGENAFVGCSGLSSVTISNGVTSIGPFAFAGCSGLSAVSVPSSVTSLGSDAFRGTAWYDNQPDGLIYINKVLYAYKGTMPENMHLTIDEGTVSIGANAFRDCHGLTSVSIPNSVTNIGYGAFGGCSNLTSVSIPNSVTNIGYDAFRNCFSLTTISVVPGNPKYDSRDNCNAIIETGSNTLVVGCKGTIIPNSVTSIGNWAFLGCSGLTNITIPNSVTNIGYGAFGGCSNLTSVSIPNSVTSIGNEAFASCTALTSVSIPNSVSSIGNWAFTYCTALTSVSIPNSVTSIGNEAFSVCSALTSIVVDAGNPKYDSRDNCNAIIEKATNTLVFGCKTTIIPNSVTSIGEAAFQYCSGLTSITIPNSVTSIGDCAFKYCSGLTEVICEAEVPPTCVSTAFDNIDKSNCCLYVPGVSVEAYQGVQPWSDFESYSIEEKPRRDLNQFWSTYCPNGIEAWYADAVGIRVGQYDKASVGAFQNAYAAYENYAETNEGDPEALLEQAKMALKKLKIKEMASGYYYVVAKRHKSGVYDSDGVMLCADGFEVPFDEETGKPIVTLGSAKYIWKFTANEGEAPTYNVQNYITSSYVNTSEHNDATGIKTGDLDQAVPYTIAFHNKALGAVLVYNLDEWGGMTCSWNKFNNGIIGNWTNNGYPENDEGNSFYLYPVELSEATLNQLQINARLHEVVDAANSSYQSGIAYVPACAMNDDFSSHGYLTYENTEEDGVVSNLSVVNEGGVPVIHPTDGEGSVAGLLDNDLSTFTHTYWENTSFPHYFEIDLGEDNALDAISVKFIRRYGNSDFNSQFTSKEMDVYARNSADEEWEKVNRLVINYNIPLYHRGNNGSILDVVDKENFVGVGACGLGDSYRYIRLAHTKTINDQTNTYFSGSEMALFGATYAEAKSLNSLIPASILDNLVAELGQAKAQLAAGKATEAQITALQEAYDAYLEKLAEVKEAYGSQEVTLVDGKVYENSGSRDVAKVTYTRTLSKTNVWNAFYVPFNIPVTPEFFEKYHVGYFNDIHSFDQYVGDKADGVLGSDGVIDGMEMEVLKVQEGAVLNANYPYLIAAKNSSALKMNIVVEDATLHRAEETTVTCSSVFMKFDVTGIYTPKTSGELKGEFNVYAMSGGGWKQAVSDAVKLNPYRLYLSLTTIEGSPVEVSPDALNTIRIRVEGENETTSIEGLEFTDKPQQTGVVYDLMGRPVANPQKGLYIVNGKKVYFK